MCLNQDPLFLMPLDYNSFFFFRVRAHYRSLVNRLNVIFFIGPEICVCFLSLSIDRPII